MTTNLIAPLKNANQIEQAKKFMADIIESPYNFDLQWIDRNKHIVIPVEGGVRYVEAEWFSRALTTIGLTECLAIATEDIAPVAPECYKLRVSQDSFLEIDKTFFGVNYILLSLDGKFAILLTSENYFLVAGSKNFVEQAIGCSIATGRKMFWSFISDPTWPKDIQDRLIAVYQRYEKTDYFASLS